MFAKKRGGPASEHIRTNSASTTASVPSSVLTSAPLVSPLRMTFDFELQPPSASVLSDDWRPSEDGIRPQTSDGLLRSNDSPKTTVSVAPPVLPPIPRIASRYEKPIAADSPYWKGEEAKDGKATEGRGEFDNASLRSQKSQSKRRMSFERPVDVFSFSRPGSSAGPTGNQAKEAGALRPSTSAGLTTHKGGTQPQMQSTIFPPRAADPDSLRLHTLPPVATGSQTNRAWIDSRDKPYSNPPRQLPPPALSTLTTHSTPDLLSTIAPPDSRNASISRSPLSPPSATSAQSEPKSRLRTSSTSPSLFQRPFGPPRLSISTTKSTQSSNKSRDDSPSQTQTIGTPYQETSRGFPLPHLISIRPKTTGPTAVVAGVNVPTHHSTAVPARPENTKGEKTEKRKTRLLNPMALLTRKKTTQEDETIVKERAAQEQALARQKNVAAMGVSKLPEDFDPRIKGKGVHDFSAPRPPRRNFSTDGTDFTAAVKPISSQTSAPIIPALATHEPFSLSTTSTTGDVPRRGSHTPVFMEHLAENPDHAARVSSLQAERLENKDFLRRASHVSSGSAFSQESFVLPPFARRSQQLDPTQASFYHDEESKRSSDPSSGKERDSNLSLLSTVSPVTARSSAVPTADFRNSLPSPVSPSSPGKRNTILQEPAVKATAPETPKNAAGGTEDTPFSLVLLPPPIVESIKENRDMQPEAAKTKGPKRDSADAPELDLRPRNQTSRPPAVTVIPELLQTTAPPFAPELTGLSERRSIETPSILVPPHHPGISPVTGSPLPSPSIPSSQPTPELKTAETMPAPLKAQPPAAPRLVEKRTSASGFSKHSSPGFKHRVSNASRFSFQLGDSAAEERALEAKHRKLAASKATPPSQARPTTPGDDDEDYFDEDAMDDMDEMEVQAAADAAGPPPSTFFSLRNASAQLQADSDSELEDDDYMAEGFSSAHRRIGSDALTLDTNMQSSSAGPRRQLYMQPTAAEHRVQAGPWPSSPGRRNRAASGISFASSGAPILAQSAHGDSSATKAPGQKDENARSFSRSTGEGGSSSSEPRTVSTGLGVFSSALGPGGSGDPFHFADTPASSRPLSPMANIIHDDGTRRMTKDSMTLPLNQLDNLHRPLGADAEGAKYGGVVGGYMQARLEGQKKKLQYDGDDEDEMYFDDGGFGFDVNTKDLGHTVDESQFDDDSFLTSNANRAQVVPSPRGHQREVSAFTVDSISSSDGPYPSFANPNPAKARQRESQLLLEDLPLQESIATNRVSDDSKLVVPHRNPSEDAKRLGRSNKVPPLPVPQTGGGNWTAMQQVSASLNAYHAALADAANKAAEQGRFLRMPSSSTLGSASVHSSNRFGDRAPGVSLRSNRSQYSGDEEPVASRSGADVGRSVSGISAASGVSRNTTGSRYNQSSSFTPPKLSFDFGFADQIGKVGDGINNVNFNTAPGDDLFDIFPPDGMEDDLFDEDDDDMIAAANSEVLASDDDGFYGQEFGFYAKARSHSSDLEAVHGGFFGDDGDDGLARNKSLKEPNLTPITERSEFSTRNSFIGSAFGPNSPALARLSVSPLVEGEITSFDQLRRLRLNAFGGSNTSLHSSDGTRASLSSLPVASSPSRATQGYFSSAVAGPATAAEAMSFAYSTGSSASSNPRSASSSGLLPFSPPALSSAPIDLDVTPRKATSSSFSSSAPAPVTVKTAPSTRDSAQHSRKSSGSGIAAATADSVAYVRELDPAGTGAPRWVLERRRASEKGHLELVGREVVSGGWI